MFLVSVTTVYVKQVHLSYFVEEGLETEWACKWFAEGQILLLEQGIELYPGYLALEHSLLLLMYYFYYNIVICYSDHFKVVLKAPTYLIASLWIPDI